jgi:serine phosphatase RsbU (regulator of sigma subunit)
VKWFFVFLLSVLIVLVAASLYIYDIKYANFEPVDPHDHAIPKYENLIVDMRHSFLGHDPEQVVCFRESHRNFYLFTFTLLSCIIGLAGHGLWMQKRSNRRLEEKNKEISTQKQLLEDANRYVGSSIRYASLIQNAFLPKVQDVGLRFPGHQLFYQPKDIVSGDFFYLHHVENTTVVAVGDCTGHGVPAAFLTLSSISQLENLAPAHLDSPSDLLNALQNSFQEKIGNPDIQFGLELAVLIINYDRKEALYSGARQALYRVRNGEMEEWKGSRKGIGEVKGLENVDFETTCIPFQEGDWFFMYSDGLSDQFGGEPARKAGRKRVSDWIVKSLSGLSEDSVQKQFEKWKGTEAQTDDVCYLSIPLKTVKD